MRDNIIMIGMPGVGKSSVGVVLAKILGYRFIDSDLVIQETEGMLLSEIMNERGVDGFIKVENDVNKSIQCTKSVVATGGSAVYGVEAMEHFKSIGKILYLKSDYNTIAGRLGDLKARGVVLREGQSLKELYDERVLLYEKYADIIVDETGCESVKDTINRIMEKLNQ